MLFSLSSGISEGSERLSLLWSAGIGLGFLWFLGEGAISADMSWLAAGIALPVLLL